LRFEELSQTDCDAIDAFFRTRKSASGNGDQFFIYDPNAVSSIDLSGASATGRHTAIFLDSRIGFVRDGPNSYSGELSVLFLD
jgi:hypothetical protein